MSTVTAVDRIFESQSRVADFAFDQRVAAVFDDMVARSVPFYAEVQHMQVELAVEFLPEDAMVVDLGCSTGTTIALFLLHPRCPADTRFMGIDNSLDMLARAQGKLADGLAERRVLLVEADLNAGAVIPPCNVVLMNWTLQFVRPMYRQALLQRVADALSPGGALFLSEKILVSDSGLNRLYIDRYLGYKRAHGYSDQEIQRKREALENVLIPYRIEENVALLRSCGFRTVDAYFRWYNFACMVAIR